MPDYDGTILAGLSKHFFYNLVKLVNIFQELGTVSDALTILLKITLAKRTPDISK